MSYTMQDFKRDYIKEHFPQLTPEEKEDVFQSLLAVMSADQIRKCLEQRTAGRSAEPAKRRRKNS